MSNGASPGEWWMVLEYLDGTRVLVTNQTGHEDSKDGNRVWVKEDGSVFYNGPEIPPDGLRIVKWGVVGE